jgi:predicted transposase/invertase (TIGR01784 family)
MASPHDALFKYVFAKPEHTASELRAIFPTALSQRLDWGSLQLEPSSFIDERLRGRQADLLFSVRCEGQLPSIYVLLEHQSTSDPIMAFRLLRYLASTWDTVLGDNGGAERLPAIVPVVLYHGKSAWAAPTELRALVDLDDRTKAEVDPYLPQFQFLLDDLSGVDDLALRGRSLTAVAATALMLLARARGPTKLLDVLRRWVDVFAQVQRAPNGQEALVAFWEYALQVGDMRPKDLDDLAREIGPTASEAYVTAAEILQAESMARGIARGREEGKAEGRAEGKAEVILRQLRLRFGVVPEAVKQRILTAASDDLDIWADRIITAASVEEVVDGPEERT